MSTILIVDDQPQLRQMFRTALSRRGHSIVTAGNGAEALRAMESKWPDLVLLDLAMPEMDGVSFLRIMRDTPEWSKIPVIVLTAFSDQNRIAEVSELAIADHLTKAEFSLRELAAAIDRKLGVTPAAA